MLTRAMQTAEKQWNDILLQWDEAEFGGINEIRVPVKRIWKPDIVLYNYADTRLTEHREAMAVVQANGDVTWIPAAIFKSTCSVDIYYFPFDTQECKMKFGSWTYDGFKLDLLFYDDFGSKIDTGSYVPSNEWHLLAAPAIRNVVKYPCCDEPYPDLTFSIIIQRIPIYNVIILIIPCILLSLLTLVSFWLPPETPAKILLGMNIFLAFFLLLKLLAAQTPSSSEIPLIGAFFCVNMVLITLSSFLSVTVINLYMRADKKNKVPAWLRKIAVDGLSRVLCMEQRKNVVTRKPKARREHVTHHVRHVIDDITAADGSRSGKSVQEKTIKSPVLPYNKWEPVAPVLTGPQCGIGGKSPGGRADSPIRAHNTLGYATLDGTSNAVQKSASAVVAATLGGNVETEVREIKRVLKSFMTKLQGRDAKEKIALEWRLVALSIDRMFFVVYLLTIFVTILTISLTCYLHSMDALSKGATDSIEAAEIAAEEAAAAAAAAGN